MSCVISLHGVSKAYRQYPSKWARLKEWILPFMGVQHENHWVLKDINLEIDAKESVALVGFNGAGKSTLLKIISGTLQPSSGQVSIHGRVSALLELGIGFHEEFTGRQNVYMSGQLMGLELDEITRLMPAIENFAEIGEYIDQPVRTYSSGMHVRLAFSVATAKRPDILIVDEALSVGDAAFQHKSFERIREFRELGTTLLIVTHDRHAVESICDRAYLIHNGTVAQQGPASQVMDYYHALMADRDAVSIVQTGLPDGSVTTKSGTGEVLASDIYLLGSDGARTDTFNVGGVASICVEVTIVEPVESLVVGILIKNRFGQEVYGINTRRLKQTLHNPGVGCKYIVTFSLQMGIGEGNYSLSSSLSGGDSHLSKNYQWIDRALIFHVLNRDKEEFVGVSWLNASAVVTRI